LYTTKGKGKEVTRRKRGGKKGGGGGFRCWTANLAGNPARGGTRSTARKKRERKRQPPLEKKNPAFYRKGAIYNTLRGREGKKKGADQAGKEKGRGREGGRSEAWTSAYFPSGKKVGDHYAIHSEKERIYFKKREKKGRKKIKLVKKPTPGSSVERKVRQTREKRATQPNLSKKKKKRKKKWGRRTSRGKHKSRDSSTNEGGSRKTFYREKEREEEEKKGRPRPATLRTLLKTSRKKKRER